MAFIKIIVSLLLTSILAVGVAYVLNTPTSTHTSTPQEFEYKHHDYIYFPGKGIIHSPECRQCAITFERI